MADGTLGAVIRRTLVRLRGTQAGSDGQLLEQFVQSQDQAAFEMLVRRHGPMVLRVCRRVLGNAHDADDAFQATFIVLARRAATIVATGTLAGWLCSVAYRTAQQARRQRGRRREVAALVPDAACGGPTAEAADFRAVLDEELERLPEKYRAPLVLCYLEGKTQNEAAEQLGWPLGTVASRLSGACDQLRGRLARRGLALSGAALAVLLAEEASASAAVPMALAASTSQVGVLMATGQVAAARALSAAGVDLADAAVSSMGGGIRRAVAVVVLLALAGVGWLVWSMPSGKTPPVQSENAFPQNADLVSAQGRLNGQLCVVHLGQVLPGGHRQLWIQVENDHHQVQRMVLAHDGVALRWTDRHTLAGMGPAASYSDQAKVIEHQARLEVRLTVDQPEGDHWTGRCTFRVTAGDRVLWSADDVPVQVNHRQHPPKATTTRSSSAVVGSPRAVVGSPDPTTRRDRRSP